MSYFKKTVNATWNTTPASYLAGEAAIAEADKLANAMELKWGASRVRLLVDTELREKFDRQRFLLNAAIYHGDLPTLQNEARRMVLAWRAVDRAAEASGAEKLSPLVWEGVTPDGELVAFVRTDADVEAFRAEGRKGALYTMDEVCRLIAAYPDLIRAKQEFPGAEVKHIRKIHDPLDGIRDAVSLSGSMDEIRAMMAG